MPALTDWDVFDPMGASASADGGPGAGPAPASGGAPFWHPSHELWVFGAVVGLTTLGLYVINEGVRLGGSAKVGPAHAEADAGI